MRYLAMIFVSSTELPQSEVEHSRMVADYARFNRDAKCAGVLIGGEALQSSESATVVRLMENGTNVMDGPFTESKESLCGFYMFECENLDQAIEWAARIPDARCGAVEVRPILEPLS